MNYSYHLQQININNLKLVKQFLNPYKEKYDVLRTNHGHGTVDLLNELVGWFVLEAICWRFINVEDITTLDLKEWKTRL